MLFDEFSEDDECGVNNYNPCEDEDPFGTHYEYDDGYDEWYDDDSYDYEPFSESDEDELTF